LGLGSDVDLTQRTALQLGVRGTLYPEGPRTPVFQERTHLLRVETSVGVIWHFGWQTLRTAA
jgi:hypothetical protein